MDGEAWLSYRDVMYFLPGTPPARALWGLRSQYFNPSFVDMAGELIKGAPVLGFWEKFGRDEGMVGLTRGGGTITGGCDGLTG